MSAAVCLFSDWILLSRLIIFLSYLALVFSCMRYLIKKKLNTLTDIATLRKEINHTDTNSSQASDVIYFFALYTNNYIPST